MKNKLKQAFDDEMAQAYRYFRGGKLRVASRHAERAHVLGQRYVVPHVRTHWLMLRIGIKHRSAKQVWGQALRIMLGALGSAIGVVPIGNTGGTDIGMFKRLPIEPDMAEVMKTDGS